jgi:hypothetical protein
VQGGKGYKSFQNQALIDVPFELWYLGFTLSDPSDDVRMIPVLHDDNSNDAFDFHLDHQASTQVNDPYSDWIYFVMPVDDTPGEQGYHRFLNADFPVDHLGQEHLARVVLMNWNLHQAPGEGETPESAHPDIGTTFRMSFSEVTIVDVDIKPGSDPNGINLGSQGAIPVAIFSTADFDATTVDPVSVTLADAAVRVKGNGTLMASEEDVNGDGLLDLIVHVLASGLAFTEGDVEAVLNGETYDGTAIRGSDSVRILP